MDAKLKGKLERRIDEIFERFETGPAGRSWRDVIYAIIDTAAMFFTYSEGAIDDFCIQSISDTCVTFGGVNRLTWSPKHGFGYSKAHCTPRFVENFEKIMASIGQTP